MFYFALRQRTVLRNLWRMASWHPEQRATHKFLSNDFNDLKWQMAAQKNAYALLSKRRYGKSITHSTHHNTIFLCHPCGRQCGQSVSIASNTIGAIEYAAAFFLLGDSLQDAVNVCVGRLGDLQLAIAITRVYEGDDGPVLKRLLEDEILPYAAQEGDRWLASWAFWMLKRKDMAVRALIVCFTPSLSSCLWLRGIKWEMHRDGR